MFGRAVRGRGLGRGSGVARGRRVTMEDLPGTSLIPIPRAGVIARGSAKTAILHVIQDVRIEVGKETEVIAAMTATHTDHLVDDSVRITLLSPAVEFIYGCVLYVSQSLIIIGDEVLYQGGILLRLQVDFIDARPDLRLLDGIIRPPDGGSLQVRKEVTSQLKRRTIAANE